MTPRSDHEEDMSMEEILASIRKFVTENPPEDPTKQQKVYNGDLSESIVIPPAGHTQSQDGYQARSQPQPLEINPSMAAPAFTPIHENPPREASMTPQYHSSIASEQTRASIYEPDILELSSPLPQTSIPKNPIPKMKSTPDHLPPWTPPSRTPFQKKTLEESIMTLTNPIDSRDFKTGDKPNREHTKPSFLGDVEDSLVSTHAIAASASSLTRLAQASKSAPKKPPSLADQRNVTLDQLIQDLIRPMIKQWIDSHLPSMVEEMVAKEIKRITKHLG